MAKAELMRANSETWLGYWEERVTPLPRTTKLVRYLSETARHNFDTMKRRSCLRIRHKKAELRAGK